MRKKKFVILTVVFFVLLLFSTGLSRIIYHASKPDVTVEIAAAGKLQRNYTKDAVFSYRNQEYEYTAPIPGDIVQIFVEEGDDVKNGNPLYQYDAEALQYKIYQNQLTIMTLQEQNKDLGKKKDLKEDKLVLYKMNALQISIMNSLNIEYEAIIQQGGLVYAQNDGEINTISIKPYSSVKKGQTICYMTKTTEDAEINWTMSVTESTYFSVGDTLKIPLQVWNDQVNQAPPILKTQFFDLSITTKEYLSNSDEYRFTINVAGKGEQGDEGIALGMDDNKHITINLAYISGSYDCIVPRSAVLFDSNTDGTVFCIRHRKTITGLEYYIEPFAVSILDEGDNYIAVSDYISGEEIVVKFSKSVDDKEAVQVIR